MTEANPRGRDECTRDPIFLLQRRRIFVFDLPAGYRWGEEGDIFDDAGSVVSSDDFRRRFRDEYNIETWDTESVWFRRGEAEDWAQGHAYRFSEGWRVYCVCCEGGLATLLKAADEIAAPLGG